MKKNKSEQKNKESYSFEDIDLNEIIKDNECNFVEFKCEPGNSTAPIIEFSPVFIKDRFMKIL